MFNLNGSGSRYNIAAPEPEVNTSSAPLYGHALASRDSTLSRNLKIARINSGLGQAEAAARLGVNRVLISKWENGVHRPSPANLGRIASLYGVSEDALVGSNVSRGTLGKPDYTPDQRLSQRAPPRARDVGLGYISRLARAGVPHDEIERFERQLFDDRFAIQFSRRHHEEWSEEDWIAHMNSVWLHATDWLLPRGIVP